MYELVDYLADGWHPTANGECDNCHAIDVSVQPDWPAEPGEWDLCEGCFLQRFADHHDTLRERRCDPGYT